MRIQVIHCHPLEDSFNHALFRVIVDTLEAGGHDVIATDLYREGFQAAMTESERRTYMANDYDDSAVAPYVEAIKRMDGVVFCFPHWWYSMPAVLKGYVDRVWGPRTAFVYDARDNHLEPNLDNIKLLGVVTTFGSPWWIVRLYAGDPGRRVFMRGLKPMCAKDVSTFWLAHYDMDHSTQQSRTAYLEKVRARLTGIR